MTLTQVKEEAKEWLLKRIDAEQSVNYRCNSYILKALEEIIEISLKYNIPPRQFSFSTNPQLEKDVREVLNRLRGELYACIEFLAVSIDKDDRDYIIAYINSESYGKTLKERIDEYVGMLEYEFETFIVVGLASLLSAKGIYNIYKMYAGKPYDNPYINKIVDRMQFQAVRVRNKGVHYGVGKSNSGFNALKKLAAYAVADAWMEELKRQMSEAVGYYSYRGSSYPCQICDDQVGYHPIEDYQGMYHANCCCIFVFVNAQGEPIEYK